jgi:hypothetical protein
VLWWCSVGEVRRVVSSGVIKRIVASAPFQNKITAVVINFNREKQVSVK